MSAETLNAKNLSILVYMDDKWYDVTKMISSFSMKGSISSISQTTSFEIIRGVYSKNFPDLTIPTFSQVTIRELNPNGTVKKNIFYGVITRIEEDDKKYVCNCYDYGFYLKNNEISETFKDVTAEEATKQILTKYQFKMGTLYKTNYKCNQVLHKKSAYDAIMSLYTEASDGQADSKKKYFVEVSPDNAFSVRMVGYHQCENIITPHKSGNDCCGNLLEVTYTEDGNNLVNMVEVVDEDYKTLYRKTDDDYPRSKYGYIWKQVVKQSTTNSDGSAKENNVKQDLEAEINSTFHGVDYTLNVKILGDWECRYGRTVLLDIPFLGSSYLKDKKWHLDQNTAKPIVGYIKTDSHEFDLGTGTYTTQLEITLEPYMDAKDVGSVDYSTVGTDGYGVYSGGQVIECSSPSDMFNKYKNYIIAVARAVGSYPSVTAAQIFCESANPFRTLEKTGHNPFGIKYSSTYNRRFGATSGSYGTTEYYGSGATHITDSFCHFTCYEDAIVANSTIFWGSAYKNAQEVLKNFNSTRDQYITALARTYATSPVYGNSIRNMIRNKGFDELDRLAYPNGRHHVVISGTTYGTKNYPADTYSHYTVNFNSTNKGNAGIGVSLPTYRTGTTSTNGGNVSSNAQINKLIQLAKSQLGVPYVWGGTSWGKGMDCSGFTQQCYRHIGISITRTTYTQIHDGIAVDKNDMSKWRPGDLILPTSHHVQLYIGNGQVIHEPHTGDVCKISNAKCPAYAVRRIIQ